MPELLFSGIPQRILIHLNALIFPPLCAFCENPAAEIPRPFEGICRTCLAKIPFRPLSEVRIRCLENRKRENIGFQKDSDHHMDVIVAGDRNFDVLIAGDHNFDVLIAGDHNFDVLIACYYETMIRKALISMKFYEAAYMKRALGCIAGHTLLGQSEKFDAVIPVPLHPSRMRERGYNQAALIAAEIAGLLDIPILENCLLRQKNTKRQSEMSHHSDRLQNVSDAFRCVDPEKLIGKRLLLVDDILTSGETLFSAANAIREAVTNHQRKTEACRNGVERKEKGLCPDDFHLTGFALASARRG